MIRVPGKLEKTTSKKSGPTEERQQVAIKHPKPKILLVDIYDAVVIRLQKAGWNADNGTFGRPYKVKKEDGFVPVIVNYSLPNFNEQEIIIIDLYKDDVADGPENEKHVPNSERDIWAKCNKGWVDPRFRSMISSRAAFDKILSNGGIFIVFADSNKDQSLLSARSDRRLYDEKQFDADIWDFLSELKSLQVRDSAGEEMKSVKADPIGILLNEHLANGSYRCTFEYGWDWNADDTKIIAVNKYGEAVALVHFHQKGIILIFPQINDKASFLLKLIEEILPQVSPGLFPTLEVGRWIHMNAYELPRVLELETQKLEIEKRAKEKIEELSRDVRKEREQFGWIQDLLTGHDQLLVEAVKKAVYLLGFQNVVDVDAERDKEGKSRREDLQIHDQSPVLIVDIKGVGGLAGDADVLQADKHATIRMREWKRTDVTPLSIINHQRHLPPLNRENNMPFRQEILDHAEESHLVLLTTWDLFRLVRSFQKNDWKPDYIKPLFYRKGRLDIIPLHYEFVGRVSHVWKDAFSINVENGEVKVNNHIAFELTSEFEEREIDSLQLEGKSVPSAGVGNDVGVKTKLPQPALKDGMPVYLVQI